MAGIVARIRAEACVASAPDMTIAILKRAYASAIRNVKVVSAAMMNVAALAANVREVTISAMNMPVSVCRIVRAGTVAMTVAEAHAATVNPDMNAARISA